MGYSTRYTVLWSVNDSTIRVYLVQFEIEEKSLGIIAARYRLGTRKYKLE